MKTIFANQQSNIMKTFSLFSPKIPEVLKQNIHVIIGFMMNRLKLIIWLSLRRVEIWITKKAKSEKLALLKEYFMLKNSIPEDQKIKVFFATAYNKFGENNVWHQANVERFFSPDELLIGKEYWDFVCNDERGFEIVFDQYKKSAQHIKNALQRIRMKYGC